MKVLISEDNQAIYYYCPGCEHHHGIPFGNEYYKLAEKVGPIWQWNGSVDNPTLSPSILSSTYYTKADGSRIDKVCHHFVRNGNIEYLGDCTHKLAGQTVEMEQEDV